MKHGQMSAQPVPFGRKIALPQSVEPGQIVRPEFGGDYERAGQISTWLPSSTTRLVGSLKNSIALSAFRSIQANNFSRQIAIPGREEASRVWRARKKLVSIILHCGPISLTCASAAGTFLAAGAGSPIAQAAALGGLFAVVALPSGLVWLAFGAAVQRVLREERRLRIFNAAMGALLALSIALILHW